MIGRTLSHFRITDKLGEGGMGEVYRAEDSKLGREVALKVLPTEMASDPERLERFSREAQAIAALTHPNIVTVYSVEEADGVHLLTMELIEGESLDQILPRSGFELDRLFPLAIQIAAALAAAHEKGVVHRDLKPANVMVTAEDRVKVLDFGLAKLAEGETEPEDAPTQLMTRAGMILGTVPYMSPEQVQGKPVDQRSDIFSFGILLYEMATGERPFQGDDPASVISAVLKDQPPGVAELKTELPNHLGRIVRRCLEKSPQRRFQSARDVQLELEGLAGEVATMAPKATFAAAAPAPRSRPHWLWPAAALLAAVVAGFVGWSLRPGATGIPLRKLMLDVESLQTQYGYHPQISPGGSRILYSEHDRIWVRELTQLGSVEIPGSLGGKYACWSPDSQQIAFSAAGRLWRVDVDGGNPTPIAPFPEEAAGAGGMVWLADGRIVVAGGPTGLLAVSDQGGSFETLMALDPDQEADLHELALLPDARRILFVAHRRDPRALRRLVDTIAVWTGDGRKDLLFLEGEALQSVAYSPTGHLLFHRATGTPGLWAVDFDLETLEVSGQPFMVAADSRQPSVAADGTLLMVHGLTDTQWELVRVDSRGRVQWSSGHSESYVASPVLSPDGTRVAASAGGDLWIYDLERSTRTRMTLTPTFERDADWSPSGDRLVFSIIDAGRLATVPASGGEVVPLVDGSLPQWSPDGESVLYSYRDPDTGANALYRLPLAGGEPQRVLDTATAGGRENSRLSPDGRLLAYSSDESASFEVYVERFPTGSGRWRISSEGGQWPRWSPDGESLYFLSGAGLAVVRILDRSPLTLSAPEVLFSLLDHGLALGEAGFEVGPDESFFMARAVDDPSERAKLALVQNWFGEFDDSARQR